MTSTVDVTVRPQEARVRVGSTATFTCHVDPEEAGNAVSKFSWEAAVRIAKETRYYYDDDRRQTVHITDVHSTDNGTDVSCIFRTADGSSSRRKGTGRIIVETAGATAPPSRMVSQGSEHESDQMTTTTAGTVAQVSYSSSTARSLSTVSALSGTSNTLILGAALVVVIILLLLMLAVKLFIHWTSSDDKTDPDSLGRERSSSDYMNKIPAMWCPTTDDSIMEKGKQAHAGSLQLPRCVTYEDLREMHCGHSASLTPRMSYTLRPASRNSVSVTCGYGAYENMILGVHCPSEPGVHIDRPSCSSSLPAYYNTCRSQHSMDAASHFYAYIDTDSHDCPGIRLSLPNSCNHYENIRPHQADYENCDADMESSVCDVTYAFLDFGADGDGDRECPAPGPSSDTQKDSTEYSKVLQILSVSRSRRGSTTVKVIETDNLID